MGNCSHCCGYERHQPKPVTEQTPLLDEWREVVVEPRQRHSVVEEPQSLAHATSSVPMPMPPLSTRSLVAELRDAVQEDEEAAERERLRREDEEREAALRKKREQEEASRRAAELELLMQSARAKVEEPPPKPPTTPPEPEPEPVVEPPAPVVEPPPPIVEQPPPEPVRAPSPPRSPPQPPSREDSPPPTLELPPDDYDPEAERKVEHTEPLAVKTPRAKAPIEDPEFVPVAQVSRPSSSRNLGASGTAGGAEDSEEPLPSGRTKSMERAGSGFNLVAQRKGGVDADVTLTFSDPQQEEQAPEEQKKKKPKKETASTAAKTEPAEPVLVTPQIFEAGPDPRDGFVTDKDEDVEIDDSNPYASSFFYSAEKEERERKEAERRRQEEENARLEAEAKAREEEERRKKEEEAKAKQFDFSTLDPNFIFVPTSATAAADVAVDVGATPFHYVSRFSRGDGDADDPASDELADEDGEDTGYTSQGAASMTHDEEDDAPLPDRQELLLWVRRSTLGLVNPPVTNFSSDWQDGRALCALIYSYWPDLIDWQSVYPGERNARKNVELAFSVAEDNLRFRRTVSVDDIASGAREEDVMRIAAFLQRASQQQHD